METQSQSLLSIVRIPANVQPNHPTVNSTKAMSEIRRNEEHIADFGRCIHACACDSRRSPSGLGVRVSCTGVEARVGSSTSLENNSGIDSVLVKFCRRLSDIADIHIEVPTLDHSFGLAGALL